jgi:hypothetical protein
VTISPDDRARIAVAGHWVSRVMTNALAMVVPGLMGLYLDRRLGSLPLLTFVGFALGMTVAIWQLPRMTGGRHMDRAAEVEDAQGNGKR